MLKNIKIRSRMIMSFATVIILSIVLAVTSITQLRAVADATEEMYNGPFQVINHTWNIRRSLYTARVFTLEAVIETDQASIKQSADSAAEAGDEIDQSISALGALFANDATDERRKLVDQFNESQVATKSARQNVIGFAQQNQSAMAMQAYQDEYVPAFEVTRNFAIDLADQSQDDAQSFYNSSLEAAKVSFIMVLVIAAVQILAAMLIAVSLTNGITKPLNKLKEAAQRVAEGEIDINIDYVSKDEMGDVAGAFRSVIETLNMLNISMKQIKSWATQGRITERVEDNAKVKGAYEDIVHGVNDIMDTFCDHFNAIPVGVGIVDTSNNKLFANPTAEHHKSIDKDNIQTQMKDFADASGRTIGSLVITIDQTTIMEAQRESERQADNVAAQMKVAEKQARYQEGEVEKLITALDSLAKGNLNIAVTQAVYDEDTHAIYDNFKKLGNSLEASCSNIRGYIDELAQVLGSIADKNLNVGIDREYLGDFAELKSSINNIANTLNEIFGEIASATNQVQTGSQQVANSSQTLAQGASEQASAVQQISSTVAEVASQTKSNAENANKANEISLSAKVDAETGSKEMDEMVKAMEAIKEASKGIASIIKVIEDIAFQTNILALNAAVEAARAGEHGKGFAVVAEEVRTLAARSAAAAKETTEMIDNSLSRVEVGSKIAGDTAAALSKIVSGVTGTVDIVGTIAEASAQQATAISQIDNGIEQISKVTQSNTATAEESASASEEMAGQAQMLQSMISEFTLRGSQSRKGGYTKKIAPAARISAPKNNDIQINLDDDFGKY